MKKLLSASLLAAITIPCTQSFANESGRFYLGTDYSQGHFSVFSTEDDIEITSSPSVASFTLGVKLTDYLVVEARLGTGVSEDAVTISDDQVSVEVSDVTVAVDGYYGLYAKYLIPLSSGAELYATAGYTELELTGQAPDDSITDTDSDYSFGFGTTYPISSKLSLNAEVMNLGIWEEDGIETSLSTFNLGFKYSL